MSFVPVAGFPAYEINRLGEVCRRGRLRALSQHRSSKGYPVVTLWHNGVAIKRKVHRLLLETFVGPCPPGYQSRHLDGDPGNFALDNLCWGTASDNREDRVQQGRCQRWGRRLFSKRRSDDPPAWRWLTEEERRAIAGAVSLGVPTTTIAAHFGVAKSTVDYWAHRPDPKRWTRKSVGLRPAP